MARSSCHGFLGHMSPQLYPTHSPFLLSRKTIHSCWFHDCSTPFTLLQNYFELVSKTAMYLWQLLYTYIAGWQVELVDTGFLGEAAFSHTQNTQTLCFWPGLSSWCVVSDTSHHAGQYSSWIHSLCLMLCPDAHSQDSSLHPVLAQWMSKCCWGSTTLIIPLPGLGSPYLMLRWDSFFHLMVLATANKERHCCLCLPDLCQIQVMAFSNLENKAHKDMHMLIELKPSQRLNLLGVEGKGEQVVMDGTGQIAHEHQKAVTQSHFSKDNWSLCH